MEDTPSPARVFFESQPQYTMQGVISFLKSEATRHEQDGSEWARERKKLTDRIDSLEHQCSAHKKMEVDLVERVKLLEFALAEERQHRFEMASSQPTEMQTPTDSGSFHANRDTTPLDARELPAYTRDSAAMMAVRDSSQFDSSSRSLLLAPSSSSDAPASSSAPAHRVSSESPPASAASASSSFATVVRHDEPSPKTLFAPDARAPAPAAGAGAGGAGGGGGVRSSIQDFLSSGGGGKGRGGERGQGGAQEWVRYGGLRSHLDGVRAVAFAGSGSTLVSAGDDGSVKLWSVKAVKALTKDGALATDVEPVITFRGHAGPVLAAAIEPASSPRLDLCASGGADASVRVWTLPPMAQDLYDSTGLSVRQQRACLLGHSDCVWAVELHPSQPLLASASADRTLRLWDLHSFASLATLSLPSSSSPADHPASPPSAPAPSTPAPTCLQFLPAESHRLLVAFTSGSLALFDVPTAAPALLFASPPSAPPPSQANALAVHPWLPLALSGHEEGCIRMHDVSSGQLIHPPLAAHRAPVTAVAIDPSGLYATSAGGDGMLHVWDLRQQALLAQMRAHGRVFGQGATSVAYHPTRPMVASGGCDALVALHLHAA